MQNTLKYSSSTGEISFTSSSRDIKNNIVNANPEITSKIFDLNPREFDYKADDIHDLGFVAEKVAEVNSNFAMYEEEKPVNINWNAITASLVAEIKKLKQ